MRAEIPIKSKRGIEYDLLDALSRNPLIIMAGDDICGAAKAEIERLRTKLASAKEVIAPFAAQGEELEYGEIGRTSIWEHPSAMNITFAHLRAAAEWMEKGDE